MAKRELTEAAKVAKIIRKKLKDEGIPTKVRSKNYSMGSSVNVDLTDQMPATVKEIERYCSQFQYGHFDGMQDMYIGSNRREDIPQTKHLFVNNHFSPELKQKAYHWARKYLDGWENLPNIYEKAENIWLDTGDNVAMSVHQILTGYIDTNFWTTQKERIRA